MIFSNNVGVNTLKSLAFLKNPICLLFIFFSLLFYFCICLIISDWCFQCLTLVNFSQIYVFKTTKQVIVLLLLLLPGSNVLQTYYNTRIVTLCAAVTYLDSIIPNHLSIIILVQAFFNHHHH